MSYKTLTVGELIKLLQGLPSDLPVYAEGTEACQSVTGLMSDYSSYERDGYYLQTNQPAVLLRVVGNEDHPLW